MSQDSSATQSSKPQSSLGCYMAIVWAMIAIGVIAAPFVSFYHAMTGFLARATEVDPIIEVVYLKYFETGNWPENLDALQRPDLAVPPDGWRYHFPDPQEPPVLDFRNGPVHMRLKYTFRKDGNPQSPGGWQATCEGSAVRHTIQERIPTRPALQPK